MVKKQRILLVDDEPHIVELVKFRLELSGYEVIAAHNGMEALEKAQNDRPDLILLDVMMPGMDGYEVATKLKENRHTRRIPIIMLTAKAEEEDIKEAIRVGAVDYIVKPFDPFAILKKISKILSKK